MTTTLTVGNGLTTWSTGGVTTRPRCAARDGSRQEQHGAGGAVMSRPTCVEEPHLAAVSSWSTVAGLWCLRTPIWPRRVLVLVGARRSAGQLIVGRRLHAPECALRESRGCSPMPSDCISGPGRSARNAYGLFLTRDGAGFCVRPRQYALAIGIGSMAVRVLGLHECRCA